MNAGKCCVSSCKNTRPDYILHVFPNPEQKLDQFNKWIYTIGGNLLVMEAPYVFKNARICHVHFDAKYYTSSRRLRYDAVPSMHLSRTDAPNLKLQDATNLSNQECYLKQSSETVVQTDGQPHCPPNPACDEPASKARGINMTVEEVSGLPTSKYAAKVQSLKLSDDDLLFLKALRRRIKNRLASQNSRRRSVEHLRRLARELRAARASRRQALAERRALVLRRDATRDKCAALRQHLLQTLHERSDNTEVPSIDVNITPPTLATKLPVLDHHISVIVKNDIDKPVKQKPIVIENVFSIPQETIKDKEKLRRELEKETDIYERVRKELQKELLMKETMQLPSFVTETLIIKEEIPDYDEITVEDDFEATRQRFAHDSSTEIVCNNICDEQTAPQRNSSITATRISNYEDNYESSDDYEMKNLLDRRSESSDRDIFECNIGKLVTQSVKHIYNDKKKIFAKTVFISNDKLTSNIKTMVLTDDQNEVLNLSVKEGRRKSHGRKQSAPKRITYYEDYDDVVLDLKVKKEPQ